MWVQNISDKGNRLRLIPEAHSASLQQRTTKEPGIQQRQKNNSGDAV